MAAASPAPIKKVLVPIAAGTEPVEASVPIDILRRAGADVTVAAAGGVDGLLVEVMYGVKVVADCADASYDLVALPGGVPGAANLGGCAALESIVRRHALCWICSKFHIHDKGRASAEAQRRPVAGRPHVDA